MLKTLRLKAFLFALTMASLAVAGGQPPRDPITAVRTIGLSAHVKSNDERVVAIVTETVEQGAALPLFDGPKAAEATAMLLLGAAFHESGLQEAVERCDQKGDDGNAYGLPQMHAEWFDKFGHHTIEEVCASRRLQWKIQANILATGKRFCKWKDPDKTDRGPAVWLANYHSGNQCVPDWVSDMEYRWFTRLCKKAGILVYQTEGRWRAVSTEPTKRPETAPNAG
jgi:hypothetical protein